MRAPVLQDFGPYRIERAIATGGMAEIYVARQRAIEGVERTVVIKQILAQYANDQEFVTMFLDEARLLAALSHPNIAQVFDLGRIEGSYYLAMEYVRGPILGKLLSAAKARGGLLPRREALGIALSIAEALHYVHERRDEVGRPLGIVHRDLNPANVIVSWDGGVKLIDFGIAKAATKVYETRTGVVKGTYGYIAPEQLAGTTVVDRRADVFALGILMYEMVVGEHPFDVSNEPNIIDRILEARYQRPRQVRPEIPRDLDRLIASCLAPHPEGRPEDMEVLIDAIAKHLGEQGMVPTQTALAAATRALVPDNEGPSPLKPLTSPLMKRPFKRDDPTGTRKVGLAAIAAARAKGTDPQAPLDISVPSRAGKDLWSDATVTFDDEEPLTLAGNPLREDEASQRIGAGDGGEDDPTIHAHRPIREDEDEAPTRLVPLGAAAISVPSQREPATGETLSPPTRSEDRTYVPPRARRGIQRVPTALLVVGALLAMTLVAASTFVLVRAFGSSSAIERVEPEAPIRPGEGVPVVLRIVSEPAGATVHVNGEQVPSPTPVVITLPAEAEQVWVRLSLAGYRDQEREVRATVGSARFVLDVLE